MKEKITLNIDKELKDKMKKIDRINNMSLSKLVSDYFKKLTKIKTEISSPILKKISGIITLKKPLDEYKKTS
ncbi:MAG: hypothetical protein HQ534_03415 [Armatimonadetes bacterium]|nr:hypothetical protein [Armatimonadota bacterium]